MSVSSPAVAILGLGAMGLPMAVRLSVDLPVTGYDPSPERSAAARAEGVAVAPTASAAVADADLALLAVRTLAQGEETLFGPDGAAGSLRPGNVVVVTSTIGSDGAAALADRLAERGIDLLDVPVSGGASRARSGELVAFVGGRPEAVSRARPVLDRVAATVVVVGLRPGDGQAMKTVNQLLCGVHIAAAAEALALARALGLDPGAALEAISGGAAESFMLSNRGPRIVEALAGGTPDVLSRVDIFVKDLGIVATAANAGGLQLDVMGAAAELFARAESAGHGADDDSSVVNVIGDESARANTPPSARNRD